MVTDWSIRVTWHNTITRGKLIRAPFFAINICYKNKMEGNTYMQNDVDEIDDYYIPTSLPDLPDDPPPPSQVNEIQDVSEIKKKKKEKEVFNWKDEFVNGSKRLVYLM